MLTTGMTDSGRVVYAEDVVFGRSESITGGHTCEDSAMAGLSANMIMHVTKE